MKITISKRQMNESFMLESESHFYIDADPSIGITIMNRKKHRLFFKIHKPFMRKKKR